MSHSEPRFSGAGTPVTTEQEVQVLKASIAADTPAILAVMEPEYSQETPVLTSASDCHEYIIARTPEELARHLKKDQMLCKSERLPSILALHLASKGPLAESISSHLVDPSQRHRKDIMALQYRGILSSIKAFLSEFQPGASIRKTDSTLFPPELVNIPTTQEFQTAIKVLEYLEKLPITNVKASTALEDIYTAIKLNIALDADLRAAYKTLPQRVVAGVPNRARTKGRKRGDSTATELVKCYMCSYNITNPHPYYPSLCTPCGSFNLQQSAISLPENLVLTSKTALVTGGRVNLGFHIALRLLRCGANVIVSSRYPLDAETRYRAEPDFKQWQNRVRVIGADFRTARDAFALVGGVKNILNEWDQNHAKLDILVNNAAQTLTDSVRKEKVAVGREIDLQKNQAIGALQAAAGTGYKARIRVGEKETQMFIGLPVITPAVTGPEPFSLAGTLMAVKKHEQEQQTSWTQTITEIPYEDVITAQAVNAFVPLILIRELLPLMGSLRKDNQHGPEQESSKRRKPLGYIINISSREGLSETTPKAKMKNGHHVHTNMSKAALNMLTETEAAPAWRERRIAMNSVDPGFMSAADGALCPIGWEDGAARALWCVARGERGEGNVWGRFLKHFGGVGAVVRQV